MKPKDWTGVRVGIRTVLGPDTSVVKKRSTDQSKWFCKCDCGNVSSVWVGSLSGKSRSVSCGCIRNEALRKRNIKHGIYGTPLYWTLEGNKKRAIKMRAMPKWADEKKIKEIYKNRPEGHDVDHIVPLTSKLVCGLHWEGNLQYLPSKENQSKKNRMWPDMPEAA